ncbi:MAG: hypothetical protein RIR70_551 [Pseudomonadota bacterium]
MGTIKTLRRKALQPPIRIKAIARFRKKHLSLAGQRLLPRGEGLREDPKQRPAREVVTSSHHPLGMLGHAFGQIIGMPGVVAPIITAEQIRRKLMPKSSLERLVTNPLGPRSFFAQTIFLVGFVFLIIAVEKGDLRIALKGQNVRGDAV